MVNWILAATIKLTHYQAVSVIDPEIVLPVCVSLVRRELVEARGLAVVLRQAATALVVK